MSVFDSIDAIENPIEINGDTLIKNCYSESIWGNPHIHEKVEQCTIYSKIFEGRWRDEKRGISMKAIVELIYFPEIFEGYVTSMNKHGICPKGRILVLGTSNIDEDLNKEIKYQHVKDMHSLNMIERYIESKLK